MERIIAAAIHKGGVIISLPAPARHHTLINHLAVDMGLKTPILGEEGFLTSTGRFVNRREAMHIATEAKQFRPHAKLSQGVNLYSEDLW